MFRQSQHLIPSLQIYSCCNTKIKICKPFSYTLKMAHGKKISQNKKLRVLAPLAPKVFFDKNKLAWIRLEDHKYPRTALWLPERYRKEALCETHDNIFAGHNAALKSYITLTTSYFWHNVYSNVLSHTQTCVVNNGKQPRRKILL